MKEFYVKFKGRILVRAENWNEAEIEAKKRFPKEGIIVEKIYSIHNRE